MANSKSIGVAYADPQFDSLIVTGNADIQGNLTLGGNTLTPAELAALDGVTAGTVTANKAVIVDASKNIGIFGTITATGMGVTVSSASTSGSVSVEPVSVSTTMTGAGGVGGRAKFLTTINSALGSFSNAVKGEVVYGAAGKTTGLGSAVLAEMTMSAGTADGTYAPVEIELNLPDSAATGTKTSLIYASVNGADKATFDTNGAIVNLAGVTAGAAKAVATPGATFAATDAGVDLGGANIRGLKVLIGGAEYYLLAVPAATYEAAP